MGNEGDVVFQIYHLWKTTSPNFMDLKLLYQPANYFTFSFLEKRAHVDKVAYLTICFLTMD